MAERLGAAIRCKWGVDMMTRMMNATSLTHRQQKEVFLFRPLSTPSHPLPPTRLSACLPARLPACLPARLPPAAYLRDWLKSVYCNVLHDTPGIIPSLLPALGKTISYDNGTELEALHADERAAGFVALHKLLDASFPNANAAMTKVMINGTSCIYKQVTIVTTVTIPYTMHFYCVRKESQPPTEP